MPDFTLSFNNEYQYISEPHTFVIDNSSFKDNLPYSIPVNLPTGKFYDCILNIVGNTTNVGCNIPISSSVTTNFSQLSYQYSTDDITAPHYRFCVEGRTAQSGDNTYMRIQIINLTANDSSLLGVLQLQLTWREFK